MTEAYRPPATQHGLALVMTSTRQVRSHLIDRYADTPLADFGARAALLGAIAGQFDTDAALINASGSDRLTVEGFMTAAATGDVFRGLSIAMKGLPVEMRFAHLGGGALRRVLAGMGSRSHSELAWTLRGVRALVVDRVDVNALDRLIDVHEAQL